ncbi:MAG: PAS domain-containing protein, partial [Bacteroidota bacterium]|nr:PAS domain-containing protein [Bacteroidota bacterium]
MEEKIEELRESEKQKHDILNASIDMIMQYDTDLRIVWANKRAASIINKTVSDIVGHKCHKIFQRNDSPCSGCPCIKALQNGNVENEIMCQPAMKGVGKSYWDNYAVPIKDNRGKIIGITEIARDITRREQAKEALKKSEAEKKAILDGLTTNIRFVDKNLKILWVNKAGIASVNKSSEEMIGHKCYEFWGDDPKKTCDGCPAMKSLRTKKTEQIVRHTPDGTILDIKTELVFDEKRNIHGVIQIAHDITDKSRLEAQLQQAQKMEAIGTLAGGIAHDFNNLLMGIQGRTSLILMDKDSSHPDFNHLQGIEESVKSAADLTKQLLGFARGGKYEV